MKYAAISCSAWNHHVSCSIVNSSYHATRSCLLVSTARMRPGTCPGLSPFLEDFPWSISHSLHKNRWWFSMGFSKCGTFHDVPTVKVGKPHFLDEPPSKRHSHWFFYNHFRSWPVPRHFDLSVFLFLLIGMVFVRSSVAIDPGSKFRFHLVMVGAFMIFHVPSFFHHFSELFHACCGCNMMKPWSSAHGTLGGHWLEAPPWERHFPRWLGRTAVLQQMATACSFERSWHGQTLLGPGCWIQVLGSPMDINGPYRSIE